MTSRYATVTLNETSANVAMELLRAGLAREVDRLVARGDPRHFADQ